MRVQARLVVAFDRGRGELVGAVYVTDAAQARRAGESFVGPGRPVLAQELVVGSRETIKLLRHRGEVLARVAMAVDRTWPPLGGSSVMRRTIVPPGDTLEITERLVSEIGLEGYSETEFRRDALNRPLLMEINPRLSQSIELATQAGVDFPRMQLEWARGGSIPRPPSATIGLRLGWLAGDLRLVFDALAGSVPPRPLLGSALRSIASDYLRHGSRLDGFSLRDPGPTFGAAGFALRKLVGGRKDRS